MPTTTAWTTSSGGLWPDVNIAPAALSLTPRLQVDFDRSCDELALLAFFVWISNWKRRIWPPVIDSASWSKLEIEEVTAQPPSASRNEIAVTAPPRIGYQMPSMVSSHCSLLVALTLSHHASQRVLGAAPPTQQLPCTNVLPGNPEAAPHYLVADPAILRNFNWVLLYILHSCPMPKPSVYFCKTFPTFIIIGDGAAEAAWQLLAQFRAGASYVACTGFARHHGSVSSIAQSPRTTHHSHHKRHNTWRERQFGRRARRFSQPTCWWWCFALWRYGMTG